MPRARSSAAVCRRMPSCRGRLWEDAISEAVSIARSSASEGKSVARRGVMTVGVESVGVKILISVDGLRGCVLVMITVAPEECRV